MAASVFWFAIFGLILVASLQCDGIVNRGPCGQFFWNRLLTTEETEKDAPGRLWRCSWTSSALPTNTKIQNVEDPEGEDFYFYPFDPSVISRLNRLSFNIQQLLNRRTKTTAELPPTTEAQALTTEFSTTSLPTTTAAPAETPVQSTSKSHSFFEVSAVQKVKEGEFLGDLPMSPRFNLTVARSQMLSKINAYRKYHKAGPLRLSRTLTKMANRLASMIILESAPLAPPSNSSYGQTLAEIILEDGSDFTTENLLQVPEMWYDQRIHYDSRVPMASSFTQLVWKSTKHIGIGVKSRHDRTVIACYYHPAGNVLVLKNGKIATQDFDINVQV